MLEEIVFGLFALGGVQMDLLFGRVPNAWNLLFFFSGLYFQFSAAYVLTALAAAAGSYLVWRWQAWGAGDAKFFAVLSAWGGVFGMPLWFCAALFMATSLIAFIPWWFKRGPVKYLRQPGAGYLVLAFISVVAVDGIARAVQH